MTVDLLRNAPNGVTNRSIALNQVACWQETAICYTYKLLLRVFQGTFTSEFLESIEYWYICRQIHTDVLPRHQCQIPRCRTSRHSRRDFALHFRESDSRWTVDSRCAMSALTLHQSSALLQSARSRRSPRSGQIQSWDMGSHPRIPSRLGACPSSPPCSFYQVPQTLLLCPT